MLIEGLKHWYQKKKALRGIEKRVKNQKKIKDALKFKKLQVDIRNQEKDVADWAIGMAFGRKKGELSNTQKRKLNQIRANARKDIKRKGQ